MWHFFLFWTVRTKINCMVLENMAITVLPYKAKTYYLHVDRAEISTILFWWSIFLIIAHLWFFFGIKHIITVCWVSIYQFLKLKSFLTQYVLINGWLSVIEKYRQLSATTQKRTISSATTQERCYSTGGNGDSTFLRGKSGDCTFLLCHARVRWL